MFNIQVNRIFTHYTEFIHKNTGSHIVKEKSHKYFLPKNDWHDIPDVELNDLISKKLQPFENTVTLIGCDPQIKYLFEKKFIDLIFSSNKNIRKQSLQDFTIEVLKRLESYSFVTANKLYSYELIFNPHSLYSTAYDYANEQQIGLHIDTNNVEDLYKRREGFGLLNINLGKSPRYYYFINLEVHEIYEILKKVGIKKKYSTARELKDDFLLNFPKKSLFRITIQPGEGYMALSHNMIHDGGTNFNGNKDICFLIAGNFGWYY